jgi:predicted nucleic acid-binding protein
MKVFLDTNILLDVLAFREPFYTDSAQVWTLAEIGRITGCISALSLSNIYYLLGRMRNKKNARKALAVMRDIFEIVPLDAQISNQAIDSDIKDFEDAVQFFSAIRAGASVLITRNPKDFSGADIAVQTPAEFLATHISKK